MGKIKVGDKCKWIAKSINESRTSKEHGFGYVDMGTMLQNGYFICTDVHPSGSIEFNNEDYYWHEDDFEVIEDEKVITLAALVDAGACDEELMALIKEQGNTTFSIDSWGQSVVVDRNEHWVRSRGFKLKDTAPKPALGQVWKSPGGRLYMLCKECFTGYYAMNFITGKAWDKSNSSLEDLIANLRGTYVAASVKEYYEKGGE